MRAVVAVAINTWREVVRDRVLLLLLVFAGVVVGSSGLMATLTFSEERKIVLDVALASMEGLGVLLALFVGGQLLVKEIDRRTLYVVLSKPVSRLSLVWGKFLGLVMVQSFLVAAMTGVLGGLMVFTGGVRFSVLGVSCMLVLQLVLLASLSVLGSAFTSPLVTSALTAILYVVGHNLETLRMLARKMVPVARLSLETLCKVLPDLSVFEVKNAWVNGVPLAVDGIVVAGGYAMAYAAMCVCLAGWLLERREW
jgi:ABC-type transport system involved in multi-copper enzyme maturation permease subunit